MRLGLSWFAWGCLAEVSLGIGAILLAGLFGIPLGSRFEWSLGAAGAGLLGVVPLLLLLEWTLRSGARWLREIREFLNHCVRPVVEHWPIWQLAAISASAGFGEELLFRGVLQPFLAGALGPAGGLVLTSICFGVAHAMTRGYAVMAGLMSVYLGALSLWSGNLLVPILTHAAYDFLALVYWLQVSRKAGSAPP